MVRTLTVAELAAHKSLPALWLAKEFDLHDSPRGVQIPYFDTAGERIAVKLRSALAAKDGSYWPKAVPLLPYGAWRLDGPSYAGRKLCELILVEGETDLWALARHELPALGLPGSGTAECLTGEHVDQIGTLYLYREPDKGGELFVASVLDRLRDLRWTGDVRLLTLPPGIKDPADLHVRDPAGAGKLLRQRLAAARPLEIPPPISEQVRREVLRLLKAELPDAVKFLVEQCLAEGTAARALTTTEAGR